MQQKDNSLLGSATQDELSACIRLLALSVAQHRDASSFVAFRESAQLMRPSSGGPEKAKFIIQSRDILEEALETVRVIAAETPVEAANEEPEPSPQEKRSQMRINVTAPVKLLWPGDDTPAEAKLQNISWGGAAVTVDEIPEGVGDTLQLLLPGTKGDPISIDAKILRSWELPGGRQQGVAIRFSSIATSDEDELEEVLKLLAQSADCEGQRQHARLTQRLDIQFDGFDELHATLDDISAGGLGVTVPDPLQIGQSLQAVISTLDEECTLKLRARVVRLEPVKMGRVELFHAGLKFEHPSSELNELTRQLIDDVVAKRA